ncbi:uncharacterized protein LOC131239026 [Magnolia sinica]|uniref:uncharacterized protein LOC131239026 n=1 Tax=Magnolia sinica TaxID=86752 RepID=UPI00265B08E3|nr:uncharacterized protein LOC131239026 [Magnolia sinica]
MPFIRDQTIHSRLHQWFSTANRSSPWLFIWGIAPSFIIWELWLGRHTARFENNPFSPGPTIQKVARWLRDIGSLLPNSGSSSLLRNSIMQAFGLDSPSNSTSDRVRIISWAKPPPSWLKLNVDGSARGNLGIGGGGGVCRDHQGCIIFVFHNFYGQVSNTVAEAQAMADGLQLCRDMGLSNIIAETDSQAIFDAIRNPRSSYHWKVWYNLGKILQLV